MAGIIPLPGHGPDDDQPIELEGTEGWLSTIGESGPASTSELTDEEQAELWNRLVGPFYDYAGAETMCAGVIPMADLITCMALDGSSLYPTFQFASHGRLVPRLPELLSVLRKRYDGWGRALWLATKVRQWGGRTAIQMLIAGELEPVFKQAQRDIERLAY
jgi:hypothetical protein